MNLLIIGAGGREHALAWKCSKSPLVKALHVSPGNGGMENLATCWGLTDLDQIVERAKAKAIDLVIVGQEDYLVHGITEKLEAAGIQVFGPSQKAAQLEGSKVFSKEFMQRHQIPTAGFGSFTQVAPAREYLKQLSPPFVIKASGLAAGKGVLICPDLASAEAGLKEILEDKAFGSAGDQIVIEEFLQGEEASYFIFTDGKDYITLPTLQDHKRQGELDTGLNTGGMGCYSPAPIVTPAVDRQVRKEIVEPTLAGMAADGHPYKGVLYIGLMIHQDKAKVVEYNIRFGDPECQPLMMLLDSDLVEIAQAVAQGKLGGLPVQWKDEAAAILVLASGGYPGPYEKGFTIQGLEEVPAQDEVMVFHAGTKKDQNRYLTNGGRVLGVTTRGANMAQALKRAYDWGSKIHWPGMQYRRDIGLKGMKRLNQPAKGQVSVGIIMGSASDKKIALKATSLFEQFNIKYDMIVASAHRTPGRVRDWMHRMHDQGCEVFIAIAGMAAHLPGVVAAETHCPVIGVPASGSSLGGQDALLSIVQMPPGIPVATVGIDRGDNAAVLALQILGIKYPDLKARHMEYRIEMEQKVIQSQQELL